MFKKAIFGGAHIEVLIKASQILKVGLMDAEYWWEARAQWLNKVSARAFAELQIVRHNLQSIRIFFTCIIITLLDREVSDLVTVQ